MVNLSKLTKAELQGTGFKNTNTARNDLKTFWKQKPRNSNLKRDELIEKPSFKYNKLKTFGIDLNEANKKQLKLI